LILTIKKEISPKKKKTNLTEGEFDEDDEFPDIVVLKKRWNEEGKIETI